MAEFPILITKAIQEVDMNSMIEMSEGMQNRVYGTNEYADTTELMIKDSSGRIEVHKNIWFLNSERKDEEQSKSSYSFSLT